MSNCSFNPLWLGFTINCWVRWVWVAVESPLISSGDTRSDRTTARCPEPYNGIPLCFHCVFLFHLIVLFLPDLNGEWGKSRNMCNGVFWFGQSLACSWFVLRRSMLFTLAFGGGNGYMLFISPPTSVFPLIILPYVKSVYVFVITILHKEPPIFYFTHSSDDPVECGPCNYYLLLIGYHISGTKL